MVSDIFSAAGHFTAHGVWCLSDIDRLPPMLVKVAGSERNMTLLPGDSTDAAVQHGRERIAESGSEAAHFILIHAAPDPRREAAQDAVVCEVYPAGAVEPDVRIAVPYSGRSGGPFRIRQPTVLRWNRPEDIDTGMELFFEGVDSHEQGSIFFESDGRHDGGGLDGGTDPGDGIDVGERDAGRAAADEGTRGRRPAVRRQSQGLNGCALAAIGCGTALLLLLIVSGLVGWWLAANARVVGSGFAATAMKEGLKELDLPPEQQSRINARIDQVAELFAEKKLTLEQVGVIFRKISEGPLMPAGLALVVKRVYIRDSGLTDPEKADAERAVHRFARGVISGAVPEETRESVLDLISTKDAQGNRQFHQSLSDQRVREFAEAAGRAADDAGVPLDIPEVNFADEFDRVIDEALAAAGIPMIAPDASR